MVRQAVFGILLTLALSGILGSTLWGQGTSVPPSIDMSRLKPDASIAIAFEPGAVADGETLWVPSRAAGGITSIDAKSNAVGEAVAVGDACGSLVVAFEHVWAPLCGGKGLARVDPRTRTLVTTVTVAAVEGSRLATSVGSVWAVTDPKGVVARIDPDTNQPVAEIHVPRGASALVAGADALWLASEDAGRLTHASPHSNEVVAEIAVAAKPRRVALGEGGVWTLNADGSVTRVDPKTDKVVATITVGGDTSAGDIAAGAGSVWVSLPGTPIVRIDPRTNTAVQRFTGEGGGAILVAHGSLWVAAGPQMTWRLDPKLVGAVRP
jgi:DNA-binding beta-propeller fold protein YncE